MKIVILVTQMMLAFSLSACVGGSPQPGSQPVGKMVENYNGLGDPGPIAAVAGDFPNEYRSTVAAYLNRYLKDPSSFKDGKIAKPFYVGRLHPAWIVCIQGRSKNSYGAYTGLTFIEIHMRNGEILDYATDEGDDAWWCNRNESKLELSPFRL